MAKRITKAMWSALVSAASKDELRLARKLVRACCEDVLSRGERVEDACQFEFYRVLKLLVNARTRSDELHSQLDAIAVKVRNQLLRSQQMDEEDRHV